MTTSAPYTPLSPDQTFSGDGANSGGHRRRSLKLVAYSVISSLCVLLSALLILNQSPLHKSQLLVNGDDETSSINRPNKFPWTNRMLSWQRTSFHFQPEKSWMNDPNAPLYHKGWYHLFYQYNPSSAVWAENITWGHAVSTDLIHWLHLPTAMVPDQPYDARGVWTGSATTLPGGQIMVLYTGNTDVQVQNLAYPADLSDPLLLKWVKYSGNPVMVPPPGVGLLDFRDPSTAWAGSDPGQWFLTIGSQIEKTGVAFVYETTDFKSFKLLDGFLHSVAGTGIWECVDFYPIDETGSGSGSGFEGTKHVLKASLYDETHDYYSIGTYDPIENKWVPDYPDLDIGKGFRLDYGKCYASKTFYDGNKGRRVLFAWIGESDSEADDLLKGWASLQGIPRTVHFDKKTRTHLLQWPIEEVESLRSGDPITTDVNLQPGSIQPIHVPSATQLDISVSFEIDEGAVEAATNEANLKYNCSTSGGAANRGVLGPFGVAVLADETLTELTPVYFYIQKDGDAKPETHFCTDLTRSSQASGVDKEIYGSTVPVLDDEKYSARILVDHSIVESFAQGGRTVITSRIYPTKAIYEAARVFLFNNATGTSVKASVKAWQMKSADIKPFPF